MERKLQTVARVARDSDGAWSESSLRWHIFHSANNGMDASRVVYRVGRKVLIDVHAFERWIDSVQNPKGQAA